MPPVTKKNSQRIITNKRTGRPMVLPSAAYEAYEQGCLYFLRTDREPIDYPVNVKAYFYMPTHRRVDLTNLLEALHDVLVRCKVLKDDNCKIIVSVDGSRVLYDRENPRTEVFIEPI